MFLPCLLLRTRTLDHLAHLDMSSIAAGLHLEAESGVSVFESVDCIRSGQ